MPSSDTEFQSRHGHTSSRGGKTWLSPTYYSWSRMKYRVLNPSHPAYKSYGGAGVTIYPDWMGFDGFLRDMGERPEGKTLDRYPDPEGNYEPSNCRWATPKEQQRNRRNNRRITYCGQTKTLVEWAEESPVSVGTFAARLRTGWSMEDAMTTPQVPNGKRKRDASGKFSN